ncbi:MAG: imidazole glycerol phosphate synthase subunit HisH [Rhodospirillaceae bacterium]|jgi:glutamine amidotransferase
MSRDICILDYGMGNLQSVANAVGRLGYNPIVTFRRADIEKSGSLIIPGVGAFGEAMKRLNNLRLIELLNDRVLKDGIPIFGICLGMQMFAEQSTEGGLHEGLGWVKGKVERIPEAPNVRIPHVGWNDLERDSESIMFKNIDETATFYFDHSFALTCDDSIVAATVTYGSKIVSAIQHENIMATQFHPEKSQNNGLRLLRNFLNFAESWA